MLTGFVEDWLCDPLPDLERRFCASVRVDEDQKAARPVRQHLDCLPKLGCPIRYESGILQAGQILQISYLLACNAEDKEQME